MPALTFIHAMKLQNWFKISLVLPLIVLASFTIKTGNRQKPPGKYAALLNLYQPVTINNFKVYSTTNFYDDAYKFKGKQLDDAQIQLLPKKAISGDPGSGLFATYKFIIDANRTGLLTRTPGQYDSSSIKLLIYDKRKDAITDCFQVAEKWADAGDTFEAQSWLFKNPDKTINCALWEQSVHDGKLDDEEDTTRKVTEQYYLFGFKKAIHDTLSTNAKAMFEGFKEKK